VGHHSEFRAECQNIKIFEGLSNSKNMVFNVKKLLNVGLGLTLRRNSRKNRCERNERQIYRIFAAEGRFSLANVKTPTSTWSF
jgi:hypothetical protein